MNYLDLIELSTKNYELDKIKRRYSLIHSCLTELIENYTTGKDPNFKGAMNRSISILKHINDEIY